MTIAFRIIVRHLWIMGTKSLQRSNRSASAVSEAVGNDSLDWRLIVSARPFESAALCEFLSNELDFFISHRLPVIIVICFDNKLTEPFPSRSIAASILRASSEREEVATQPPQSRLGDHGNTGS